MPARKRALPLVLYVAFAFGVVACSGVPQPSDLSLASERPSDGIADPSPRTTRDVTAVALEIATGDDRLAGFLGDHPFEVDDVRVRSGDVVDVFVRFDEPVPTSEWPRDMCEPSAALQPMTGVHWRVTLSSAGPPAVSPMWGDVSCISYDDS